MSDTKLHILAYAFKVFAFVVDTAIYVLAAIGLTTLLTGAC